MEYENNRPSIPATTRREIEIEAGYKCTIKDCNEDSYLEIHHINENRENNVLDNLILLCRKHHSMAHDGKIDRKALKIQKKLLNLPIEPPQKTNEEIKKERDIENLKSILRVMPLNTIQEMINDLPRYLRAYQIHFFTCFNEIMNSPNFHIYNSELNTLLESILVHWENCIMCGQKYRHGNESTYFFSNPLDAPLDEDQEIEWNKILNSRNLLNYNLSIFINIIRNDYIIINIEEMNNIGMLEYRTMLKDLDI